MSNSIGHENLSGFDLKDDGLGHIKKRSGGEESYELGSLQVAGQMVDIDHIVKAESDPDFLYGVRTMACCNAAVKKKALLLVSEKHFIVPCYQCEVWSHWKRGKSGGFDLSIGWFRRKYLGKLWGFF